MFEPVRGGTRGGQAEFKWADVSADKDRENYLGHSVNAPTGRWQKNKDIHWYNRDLDDKGAAAKAEEIRKIKELEAEALSAALGFEPTKPGLKSTTTTSGANAVPVASSSKYPSTDAASIDPDKERRRQEKEERRRLKAAHKEEKLARRALKELSRSGAHEVRELEDRRTHRPRNDDADRDQVHDRYREHGRSSRSRSPRRRLRARSRSRSRTPTRASSGRAAVRGDSPAPTDERVYSDRVYERKRRVDNAYDEEEREYERERDRMRWEHNSSRRETPRNKERELRRW